MRSVLCGATSCCRKTKMESRDLKTIAVECSQIAADNGFERATWDNFVAKVAFAIGEVDEGRDGALGLAKDPLAEELADTAIRLLAVLGDIWGDAWGDRVLNRHPKPINMFTPIEVLLWPVVGHLCKAMEARRHDHRSRACQRVELALLELWRLGDALGIDLTDHVLAKCEKNRGRPHLHGKKYAVG